MVKPIIHINGTPASRLMEQASDAAGAIREALQAVAEAAPNGRDYYLQAGLFEKAEKDHLSRIQRLESVLDEYEDLMAYLVEYT